MLYWLFLQPELEFMHKSDLHGFYYEELETDNLQLFYLLSVN